MNTLELLRLSYTTDSDGSTITNTNGRTSKDPTRGGDTNAGLTTPAADGPECRSKLDNDSSDKDTNETNIVIGAKCDEDWPSGRQQAASASEDQGVF